MPAALFKVFRKMSLYDIEQKILGGLAEEWKRSQPVFSSDLYKILGITTMLHGRVTTLRTYAKSSTVTQNEVRALLDHVLLLVNRGLALVESRIMPFTDQGQRGRMLQVMTAKLRASFYHTLSLHHNGRLPSPAPLSNRAKPETHTPSATPRLLAIAQQLKSSPPENTTSSGTSFLTNPWAQPADANKGNVPPEDRPYSWGLTPLPPIGNVDKFIMSKQDHIPRTSILFQSASTLAKRLPGSATLRLAVILEQSIFLAECVGDEVAAEALARQGVNDCYAAEEGIEDLNFDDAVVLVTALRKYAKM